MPAFIDLNLNQALQALRLQQLGSLAAVKQDMTSAWQKRVIVRDVVTGAIVCTQKGVNSLSKAESLVSAEAAHVIANNTTSTSSSSSAVAPQEQITATPTEPSASPKESKAAVATVAQNMSKSQSQATYGRVYVSNVSSSNIKVLPGVVRNAPAATTDLNTTKENKSTATTPITTDAAANTATTTKKKAASTDESKNARKRARTSTRKKKERVTNDAQSPDQSSWSIAHSTNTIFADSEVMGADMGPEVEAASPLSAVDILRVDTSTHSPLLQPNLQPELLVGGSSAHAPASNLAISPATMSSAAESSSTFVAVDTETSAAIFAAEMTEQSNATLISALKGQSGNTALSPQAPVDYDLPDAADAHLSDAQEGSLELRRKDQLSVAPALQVVPHSGELSALESGNQGSGTQERGVVDSDIHGSGEQGVVTPHPQNVAASPAAAEVRSEKTETAPVGTPEVTANAIVVNDSAPATTTNNNNNTQSEATTEEQPTTTAAKAEITVSDPAPASLSAHSTQSDASAQLALAAAENSASVAVPVANTTTDTDTDTRAPDFADDDTFAASSESTEPPAALSLAGATAMVSAKSAVALRITPHTLNTAPSSAESTVAMTGSDSASVAAHFAFAPVAEPEPLKAALQVPQPDTSAVQIVTPDTTESKNQKQSELALHSAQPTATLSALDTSSFTVENDAMARQPAVLPSESPDSAAVPEVGTTGDLAASLEAAQELKSVGSATALTAAPALLADSESSGTVTESEAGTLEIEAAALAVGAEAVNNDAAHYQGESALRSMASVNVVGTAALAADALSVDSESTEESTLATASTLTLAVAGESASASAGLAITSSNQSAALVAATVEPPADTSAAAAHTESSAATPEAESAVTDTVPPVAESDLKPEANAAESAAQAAVGAVHEVAQGAAPEGKIVDTAAATAYAPASLLSSSDHTVESAAAALTQNALPDENAESLLGGDVFGASHTDLLGTAAALFLGDTGTGAAPVSPLLASTTPHEGGLAITRATPASDDDASAQ